jgi:hypothetical protein
MNVFWIPVISIAASACVIIAVVAMGAQTKQRIGQHKTEVQLKLIERFGTSADFVAFIQSDEGRRFLGDAPRAVRERAVGGLRSGIIMAFVGAGFAFIGLTQRDVDWLIPAFMLMGLGLGFFVSALISMRLSRKIEKEASSHDSIGS